MKIFKHKFVLALLGVLIIGGASLYAMNQPPSIEYLKEHPEDFRFEDYWGREQIEDVLNKMFPVGTPKSEIDKVFIEAMQLEESVPWHRRKLEGNNAGTTIVPEPASDHYFVYYFKPESEKEPSKGKALKLKFSGDHLLNQKIHYKKVTGVKNQGFDVNFLINYSQKKNENE